jgi:putative membrane protein
MGRDELSRNGEKQTKADPRDLLALQRTRLAVERTFLSFVRTGLAILAGAVGVPYIFAGAAARVAGWVLGALACSIVIWGIIRFTIAKRRLERQRRELTK